MRIGAAFGSDGMISASSDSGFYQLKGNKIRACAVVDNGEIICSLWNKTLIQFCFINPTE